MSSSHLLDLEHVLYVIQRKHPFTGEWRAEGLAIVGKTKSNIALNEVKQDEPGESFRAVQKEHADVYRQGWKDAMVFANQHGELTEQVYEEVSRKLAEGKA